MLDKLDLVLEIEELLETYGNYINNNYQLDFAELIIFPSTNNNFLTCDNFLLDQKFVEPTNWKEFSSYFDLDITIHENDFPDLIKDYEHFIEFIECKLNHIEAYKVNLGIIDSRIFNVEEIGYPNHAYCLTGEIEKNYWLNIAPYFCNFQTDTIPDYRKFILKDNTDNYDRISSEFVDELRLHLNRLSKVSKATK